MSESELHLAKAPIVEAVVDIDCDMPPAFDLTALEGKACEKYRSEYPKFRAQFLEQHSFESKSHEPAKHSARRTIQAFQFQHDDEKQLVQIRAQGFSFNRLAPYTSLDGYLSEIQRAWKLFVEIAMPVQFRTVRLRYINRILLPMTGGRIALDKYIQVCPRLPDEDTMEFASFLNQHVAVEIGTGYQVNSVLTAQRSQSEKLPIIFDNCVVAAEPGDPQDWDSILSKIQSLRDLKNRIFRNTLTDTCMNLFQDQD